MTENNNRGTTVTLEPNEVAEYHKQTAYLTKEQGGVDEILAWKNGIMLFQDAGFKEIVAEMERWYGVAVKVDKIPTSQRFTGEFDNETLENVVVAVAFAYGLQYEINGSQVRFKCARECAEID